MGHTYSSEIEGKYAIHGTSPNIPRSRTLDDKNSAEFRRDHSSDGIMSETDTSATGFARGGKLRSSLPIVRTPSKSLEKPLGLVFLVYRDETKRALLPNEITCIDTVKALFVRSFPKQLTFEYLNSTARKIYILDDKTGLYYELENVGDVKDRSVLKVQEFDAFGHPIQFTPTAEGLAQRQLVMSSSLNDSAEVASLRASQESMTKNQPPPKSPQPTTFTNGHPPQPRPSPQSSPYRQPSSLPQSPQRVPRSQVNRDYMTGSSAIPQQRHSLSFMPSSSTGSLPENIPSSQSYHAYMDKNGGSGSGSVTPKAGDPPGASKPPEAVKSQVKLSATVPVFRQRRFRSNSDCTLRPFHQERRMLHLDIISENKSLECHRMAKMEAQLANLTAWVQTAVVQDHALTSQSQTSLTSDAGSMRSSLSDSSTATPTPAVCNAEFQYSLRALHSRAKELSSEVKNLRRMQLHSAETIRETIHDASKKFQSLLLTVPGANEQPVRAERIQVNEDIDTYRQDAGRVDKLLCDLEESVEELRNEVVNRRCRVTQTDVEGMALALSQISRNLADFKGKFPEMMDKMKKVMAGEMEIVVREEKFLKEEPERIDSSLRRCKKITGTLYTLKRLASVQENKPPIAPNMATNSSPKENDKRAVMESIQALVPDHERRVEKVEAAEASRERKKNMTSQQESLKFQKSLEMASKNLKDTKPDKKTNGKKDTKDMKKDSKVTKDVKGNSNGKGKEATKNGKEKGKDAKKDSKDKGKDAKDKGKMGKDKKGKKEDTTPNEMDDIQKVITQENEIAVCQGDSCDAETPTIQIPQTVEYIMVPTQNVTRNAPAPKLSSFSPPPTTNFDNYYSNFSKLLVSTAHVRGRSVSPEPVYSRPCVQTEPQSVHANHPIGSPQQNFGNHLENPYAIGRPRPASISGPIHSSLHERQVVAQHTNDVMSKSTTSAEQKTVTFDPWVEMREGQSNLNSFGGQSNGNNSQRHSRPLPVHISEKQHNMFAPVEPVPTTQVNDNSKKRVPPPPPPRKSSRASIQAMKARQSPTGESDYENIESVRAAIKEAQSKRSPGQGQTPSPKGQGQTPSPKQGHLTMVPVAVNHARSNSEPVSTSTPIEKQRIIGRRPENRFQKDLMAGMYANMNRPDLQDQNINIQKVVHSPERHTPTGRDGQGGSSDSSESSSLDSQKGHAPQQGPDRDTRRMDMNDGSGVGPPVSIASRQQMFEKQAAAFKEQASLQITSQQMQHRLSQGDVGQTSTQHRPSPGEAMHMSAQHHHRLSQGDMKVIQMGTQHRLSQGEMRKAMQMHEQYSKYGTVKDQRKHTSSGSSPQEVKANNVRTEITHNPCSNPQTVTSPIITRSKVVINLQTGRKEEETDIY
ncbi:uncharacterized protein LOC135500188 isoform X2 [Lineus longissimus]|uniref:uncharacterized protein LOC135500188 isoform X2 n=1 Tax=Lineus longissimus TaxID=88925 RepID=UPI00315D8598